MSTTFGITIKKTCPFGGGTYDEDIEVAFRSGTIRFTNDLAHLLPDETPVKPLDNSHQGIFTIGDIKASMKEEEI